jgi:hypothetical protein
MILMNLLTEMKTFYKWYELSTDSVIHYMISKHLLTEIIDKNY